MAPVRCTEREAGASLFKERCPVVVMGVGFQNPKQMRLAQDSHMIDAFALDRSDKPFSKAILPGRGWLRVARLHKHLRHDLHRGSPWVFAWASWIEGTRGT